MTSKEEGQAVGRAWRRGQQVAVLAAAAGVIVSGCAAPASTEQVTQSWDQAQQRSAYTENTMVRVAEWQQMRTWDPCALHSPQAAEKITGDDASELAPSSLSECTLRLERKRFERTWTFDIEVGADFEKYDKENAAPQKIDANTTVYRSKNGDNDCHYKLPTSEHFAIELTARIPFLEDAAKKPCEVAFGYVKQVLPRWQNPPTRKETVTLPQIALASQDPCEVPLATAQEQPPPNVSRMRVEAYDMYGCSLLDVPKNGSPDERFTVRFSFSGQTEARDQGTKTTVSGRPARTIKNGNGCTVRTDFNPKITVDVNEKTSYNTVYTPVVTVEASTCQNAKLYLERVLKAAQS